MARILVLGAYGLIGAHLVRGLRAKGHDVIGLGRSRQTAKRVLPGVPWIIRDLRDMQTMENWRDVLADVDFVVNAAGALQDGPRDDLSAVQTQAIAALAIAGAQQGIGLIQISAVGAGPDAKTHFMRSKAKGDAAIRQSGADWWIFRPGLVIAPNAYGGTALIRGLAAIPLIHPLILAGSTAQCVSIDAVAKAVVMAIDRDLPPGFEADLVENIPNSLSDIVDAHRSWMGLPRPLWRVTLPTWCAKPITACADALGWLGWRSPLRSTALVELEQGIAGDPEPWRDATGHSQPDLGAILARYPVGAETRMAARMWLLTPLVLATLIIFWFLSGVLGFIRLEEAASILKDAGWSPGFAVAAVASGSTLDIGLAALAATYATSRMACLGMVFVSLGYLFFGSIVQPELWLDPLGPFAKVLPAMVLAVVARALLAER